MARLQLMSTTPNVPPDPSGLSLRRNFSWTAFGNVIYAACQWGMITVLAKLVAPEMVGQFALGLSITAPIILFANLQLRAVQATDANREYKFSDYLTLRIVTTIIAMIVTVGVVVFGGYRTEAAWVIVLIAFAKGIDAISDIFYGLFQQREQMDRISKSLITNGGLSLLLLGLGVFLTGNLIVGVAGFAIGSLLPLLVYVIPTGSVILTKKDRNFAVLNVARDRFRLSSLTRTALPLGVSILFISLNTNLPRYFIEASLGQRELGVFAALGYLIVAGNTVISALGQAASPRLASYYAQKHVDQFKSLLVKLICSGLAIGAIGAVVASMVGKEIIAIIYTSEYTQHINVLIVLAVAAGVSFAASFAGYGITATRYFNATVPVFALVLIVGFSASVLLIPTHGLLGAAYVTLITACVQLALSIAIVRHALLRITTSQNMTSSEPV